jgi:predicted nucleotidyltransferase component of viral defense system
MLLHENKKLFEEHILSTDKYYGINDVDVIEKDYYVTMFLKKLYEKQENLIFKGGTALSKCFKVIERFSEDVDLTVICEKDKPTEGMRKKLKRDILDTIDELGCSLVNPESIRSRRDFNKYIISFGDKAVSPALAPNLIVETAVFIKSYPTEMREANSLIFDFLKMVGNAEHIIKYDIAPFELKVQSMSRTFVDKVFAVCDYYISGKVRRNSRHIYDLHMIYPHINFDNDFRELVRDVRSARMTHNACFSASPNININEILTKIIKEDFYYSDFNKITSLLLFKPLPYEEVITVVQKIIDSEIF